MQREGHLEELDFDPKAAGFGEPALESYTRAIE